MSGGTFQVLLVFIDAEEAYAPAALADELLPEQIVALELAGGARSNSFLMLARRNWELECVARRVRLPREVQGLTRMPEDQAVDRLLGYEEGGGRWRAGLAGLQPAEARVVRLRVIDRRSVAEVAWALGVRERTVVNHMTEARRKLRAWFGLASSNSEGYLIAQVELTLPAGLAGSAGSAPALVAS